MAAVANNNSALLALPVELVHRIADHLEDESLLQLRLTCKALETIRFDRFAEAYVVHQSCWIYEEERWKRLYLIFTTNRRLSTHIKTILLTVDVLEASAERALDTVEFGSLREFREWASMTEAEQAEYAATERDTRRLELQWAQSCTAHGICENESIAVKARRPSSLLIYKVMEQAKLHRC